MAIKGKDWYQIFAPKFFGDKVIGETLALDPNSLTGRVVESSMIDLSDDPTRYYIKLFFKITNVEGTKLATKYFGHDCTRDFIARIVQKRTSRIDTNDIVEFKDGKLRIKCITVANRKVPREMQSIIRKEISSRIKELGKESVESFVKGMISGRIQQSIMQDINKIYPLRFFEFRKTEVL